MAERLDSFDFSRAKRGRVAIYPWDEWLDGSIWQLTRGEDFACKPTSFRTRATDVANSRGLSMSVRFVNEDTIVLRARPRPALSREQK